MITEFPSESARRTTEALLLRAREGDREAWGQLIGHLQNDLLRVFHGQIPPELRGRLETGDIFQAGMLDAVRGADQFEDGGPGSARAWFVTVIKNAFFTLLRRQRTQSRDPKREVAVAHEGLSSDSSASGARRPSHSDPATAIEELEMQAFLLNKLADFPEREREVLVRKLIQGHTFDKVAEDMGLARTTVRRICGRAVAKLEAMTRDPRGGDDR